MMVQQSEHTILIAMTDPICKNDVVNFFRQENYRFLCAGTGEEAIGLFMQHPEVELILIDIDLPVINGIETIRRVKQLDTNVPVILLVNYLMLESLRLAQNLGCNEILQTPLSQGSLDAIFTKYLYG
ncbi:MAG: response regulator [Bacteroidota bacterium]